MRFSEWSKQYTKQIRIRKKAYELLRDYSKANGRKMYNVASAILIYELEERAKKAAKHQKVKNEKVKKFIEGVNVDDIPMTI